MARIRSIKPEFCVSEQLAECSTNARLVFILMWPFCDDQGIHPAKCRTLKGEVFPLDEGITTAQVQGWVAELVTHGLLHEYQVGSDRYWLVTGWAKHQKIDKPSKKHPLPLAEDSPKTPRTLADASPPEWKGGDGNGGEETKQPGKAQQSSAETAMSRLDVATLANLCAFHRVFPPDAKGKLHLRQWAEEGVTQQQVEDAIAIARDRLPEPQTLRVAYLAPIVADLRAGRIAPKGRSQADNIAQAIANVNAKEAANAAH